MPERVTANQDSAISPATGKKIGQHEAAGLKGLTKEQHHKFWEEVTYWNKERFSEAKWQEVLRRIWRAKQESRMIVLSSHPPPRPTHSIDTPTGRHLLLYSSSSLTAPTGAHPLRPAHLPRIETSSPTTSRPRWDVVSAGPATPLSSTAGPVKNAFAEGGFWASLTPKTSAASTPSSTSITAIPSESWAFDTPIDPAAKMAYEEIKTDVQKMALQLCASRYSLRRSFNTEYDVIHPSMVRPRDTLLAAQLTLSSNKPPHSLSSYIDPILPAKIEHYADEEAVAFQQYSISSVSQLEDVDAWLQYDEKTGELTTILEAQRDLLRMTRERRKGKEVAVGEGGVRLAWATKVVGDAEAEVQRRRDVEGDESDEDAGYEYGNFVRSLGGRGSDETWYAELTSLRSSGSTVDLHTSDSHSSGRESDIAIAQRSASSPIKPIHGFAHDTLALRSQNFTLSAVAPSPNSNSSNQGHKPSYTPTRGNTTAPISLRNRNLNINTTITTHTIDISGKSLLSPQERGTRHQGPSIEDLSSWADELKKMERKRAEVRLGGGMTHQRDYSVPQETREDDGLRIDELGDGLMINGSVHPALRGGESQGGTTTMRRGREKEVEIEGGRGASGSSTASWRCKTAAGIERGTSGISEHEHDNTNDSDNQACEEENYENDSAHDEEEEDDEQDLQTPRPFYPSKYPLRSSSSPTHPPIQLSSLSLLRLSPPRRPPRPLSPEHLLPSGNSNIVPPTSILLRGPGYNRYAATSYERQASRPAMYSVPSVPLVPSVPSVSQRVVSKAALLEEAVTGSQHMRSRSRQQEEEWEKELKAMEGRERMRQLEGDQDVGS